MWYFYAAIYATMTELDQNKVSSEIASLLFFVFKVHKLVCIIENNYDLSYFYKRDTKYQLETFIIICEDLRTLDIFMILQA